MTDRLKLSDPSGDAEAERIAFMLEMKEHSTRIEQLEKNIALLEGEASKKKTAQSATPTGKNKLGARKVGTFKAISTAPSINKTPIGPSMVPIPYPTVQDLSNSVNTARSVRFNGEPAYLLDASTQPRCKGDEAGTGKGIKSGTVSGEVKPVVGSRTVRIEGKNVVREGDACTMNGGNNPGIYVMSPPKSTAAPKDALATSNPPTVEKRNNVSWFETWVDQTKANVYEALAHPWEGVKGAIKGMVNIPSHLSELLLKGSARQQATELHQAQAFQSVLGQTTAARKMEAAAAITQQQAEKINVPKFSMSNAAQEGGDTISTLLQLVAGGIGIAKTGAKGAAKLLTVSKEVKASQTSTKIIDDIAAHPVKVHADPTYSPVGPSGDGVRVVPLAAATKNAAVRKLLEDKWGADAVKSGLEQKIKDPMLNSLLTDNEYLTIQCYTSSLYKEINALLRSGTPGDWLAIVEEAKAGMAKLSENGYKFTGPVRRDADFTPDEIKKLFPDGGIFLNKTFVSSTTELKGVFTGNTEIYIESIDGIDVSSMSKFPNEKEILFKPETNFKVISKTTNPTTKKTIIILEEID